MSIDKTVENIKGVFANLSKESWKTDWVMDEDALKEIIVDDELVEKIIEDFEKMKNHSCFKAQILKISGENYSGDPFERYALSLGGSIYSHHYTYFPNRNNWYMTTINQEFFEDVVQPFQKGLSRNKRAIGG